MANYGCICRGCGHSIAIGEKANFMATNFGVRYYHKDCKSAYNSDLRYFGEGVNFEGEG